jgi:hypothetical protein
MENAVRINSSIVKSDSLISELDLSASLFDTLANFLSGLINCFSEMCSDEHIDYRNFVNEILIVDCFFFNYE